MRFLIIGAVLLAASTASAQTQVERGSYLVNSLGACSNCHTPRAQGALDMTKLLSGGFQTFDEPWFVVKGANLTPDKETGLGNWTLADFKRAMRDGDRPDGVHLAMTMPVTFYKVVNDRDLEAMWAYLRTIPAVRNQVQTPVYKAPNPEVALLAGTDKPLSEDSMRDPVKRGLYVSSIAHCMACHARRSISEGPDLKGNYGRGGRDFKGPWGVTVAANITSHPTAGLGAWSDDELRRVLTEGTSRDGHKLKPPMIDYVAFYKTWSPADINALIAWLRTIPPLE